MASAENAALIASLRGAPPLSGTSPAEWRVQFDDLYRDFPYPDGVRKEAFSAEGGIEGEWFRVGGPADAAILYLHGGGFMLGSTRSHGQLIANIAAASGIDALGVNYRLAPEHRFPAQLEDCLIAYRHLLDHGYQSGKIAIVGDSAGAGLAAAVLLAIRDRGLPTPGCGVLISGWFDLTNGAASLSRNAATDPLVMLDVLEAMSSGYLDNVEDRRLPLVSPVFADFTGLPPLLIQASAHEGLADDSVEVGRRAAAAGVPVSVELTDEVVHVWHQYAHLIPEGREAVARAGAFIRDQIEVPAS